MNNKFKVGDRVRVMKIIGIAPESYKNYIGKIYTIEIVNVSQDGWCENVCGYIMTNKEDEINLAFREDELTLVTDDSFEVEE